MKDRLANYYLSLFKFRDEVVCYGSVALLTTLGLLGPTIRIRLTVQLQRSFDFKAFNIGR